MYGEAFEKEEFDDIIGTRLPLPDELRDQYPNLYLALGGREGSKKAKTAPIQPATIILFARDGGIGFVIAPKDSPRNAHGFVRDPVDLLMQIEAEIDAGRIGWKPPSKKRS